MDRRGLQTRVAHIYFDISVGVRKEIINWLFFAAVLAIKSWCFWRQILAGCRRISHRTLKQFEPAAKIKSLSVRLTSQTNLLRLFLLGSVFQFGFLPFFHEIYRWIRVQFYPHRSIKDWFQLRTSTGRWLSLICFRSCLFFHSVTEISLNILCNSCF